MKFTNAINFYFFTSFWLIAQGLSYAKLSEGCFAVLLWPWIMDAPYMWSTPAPPPLGMTYPGAQYWLQLVNGTSHT